MTERLQKYLARAGVASRRHAEGLITAGRVSVNNERVTELGTKIDPEKDLVSVDGKHVSPPEERAYFLFYKPVGVVTTLEDPEGRPSIKAFVQDLGCRVFPVGRLDYDAEGALLLTDDGELANRLMHPRYQVERTYLVKVKGIPTTETLDKLRGGVRLEDGFAKPASVDVFEEAEKNLWIKLVVTEGRPHLVKRLCAAIGHPVLRLFRPSHGGIPVDGLKPGELRPLSAAEVERLNQASQGEKFPEAELRLPARRHGRAGELAESLGLVEPAAQGERSSDVKVQRFSKPGGGRPAAAGKGDRRGGGYGTVKRSFPAHEDEAGSEGAEFGGDRGEASEADDRGGKRSEGGARGGFGAKRSFGERGERSEGGGKRSFGERSEGPGRGGFGAKRSFGERSEGGARGGFGAKRSSGERSEGGARGGFGAKRSFGERGERTEGGSRGGFGAKRSFGERGEGGGKRSFGERSEGPGRGGFGAKRSFGERSEGGARGGFGAKRSEGERSEGGARGGFGTKRSFGERGERSEGGARGGFGAKRSFGERGERSEGGARGGFGGKRSFGERGERSEGGARGGFGAKRSFGERGERSEGGARGGFGAKRSFGDRGERSEGGSRGGFGAKRSFGGSKGGFGGRSEGGRGAPKGKFGRLPGKQGPRKPRGR